MAVCVKKYGILRHALYHPGRCTHTTHVERVRHIQILMHHGLHYAREIILGILNHPHRPSQRVFSQSMVNNFDELRLAARAIREQKPDGIIVHLNDLRTAEALADFGVPVVNTGNAFGRWPRVGVDDVAIGRMIASQFLRQGFRNFAFVHLGQFEFSTQRQKGFAQALAEKGFSCAEFRYPAQPENTQRRSHPPSLMESATRWVLTLPRNVAIMTAVDGGGDLLTRICVAQQIKVPEEIAVIGVDNDEIVCGLCDPPLSSVELPLASIGTRAVDILEDWIDGKEPPSEPVLLPPVCLVPRQSSDVLMVDDPDVAATLRFIRLHAGEPIKVSDILNHVPVARRSLERRFSRRLGRGLLSEIRRVRIDMAKQLLATTSLDMPAIAQRTGFVLATTFCKVFRSQTSMSPTEYRRIFHVKGGSIPH